MTEQTPPAKPAEIADPGTAPLEPDAQTVSVEDFKKVQNQLAALQRILTKQAAPIAPANPPADPEESKTQRVKLEELQASMRRDRERLETKARRNGIREAIAENGITEPDAIEILFDHVERKHGGKIKVGDDDQTSYEDELGDVKSVSTLIGDILKGPKGQFFRPIRAPGPNTRAARGNSAPIPGQKSYLEMSTEERLKLTPEQTRAAIKAAG
jgi:hypothetical protein